MILIDIEVWNEMKKEFEVFEGLVDTGATYCVVEKSIAEKLGLPSLKVLHLWQMGDALNVPQTIMRVKYGKKEYKIESLIVEVKTSYKRSILPKEKCMRPESPHPLTNRIVVGKSFLDKLTKEEYRKLFM